MGATRWLLTQPRLHWVDPRSNPAPPFRGPQRPFAKEHAELAGLISACREGRLYDAETWIASGGPLQLGGTTPERRTRRASPLAMAISEGSHDFVLLLLCNGYRTELESDSPLNAALETRRWDILYLLLDWGADPAGANVWRILDTYERAVFDRFWAAGVDLAGEASMADALARSTRNRPLYGFAKNYRERDPRIQRALDVALGAAIGEHNHKAVSLCLWAGADPRRRVGDLSDPEEEDAEGMTAIERSISEGLPQYLSKLGFDPARECVQPLYQYVHDSSCLRLLAEIEPPSDWHAITSRTVHRFSSSTRFSIDLASMQDLKTAFDLGGRLGILDRDTKRDLRHLLLKLGEPEAQDLFRLLRDPENMDPEAFIDLIAHERLAARYMEWPSRRASIDRALLEDLVAARRLPGSIRRWARAKLVPEQRILSHTYLESDSGEARLFSREELYELIWSEPLVTLSKRFGLSDNGLRKRCKAMRVPTPPPGYWQKTRHGKPQNREPLPRLDHP